MAKLFYATGPSVFPTDRYLIGHESYMQCDQKKKLPKVYQSCQKMISLERIKILTPIQKLPMNVGDFGKIIVAKGFKNLAKVK